MTQETQVMLNTLLILLIALVQFFLRKGPQSERVKELETRLEEAEQALEDLLRRLDDQELNQRL